MPAESRPHHIVRTRFCAAAGKIRQAEPTHSFASTFFMRENKRQIPADNHALSGLLRVTFLKSHFFLFPLRPEFLRSHAGMTAEGHSALIIPFSFAGNRKRICENLLSSLSSRTLLKRDVHSVCRFYFFATFASLR